MWASIIAFETINKINKDLTSTRNNKYVTPIKIKYN